MSRILYHGLHKGGHVHVGDQRYVLVDFVSMTEVVLEDDQQNRVTKRLTELTIAEKGRSRGFDLATVAEKKWQTAWDIHREVQRVLQHKGGKRVDEVDKSAKVLGVSRATMYRYLDEHAVQPSISGFMRKPRSDLGKGHLVARKEELIAQAIEEVYLTEQRKPVRSVVERVEELCKAEETPLAVPHVNTITARIKGLPLELVEKKRYGKKRAKNKFDPVTGSFPNADYPLAVVQMDHTPMDVIIVDDEYRESIGRPFLTLAIDVKSRMVVGFYISLEHAGALATGLCMAIAILPKDGFLRELGLDPAEFPWPCQGKMRVIHTDNAKEFRGTMLARAAAEHGIFAERRPVGEPKFGGTIERSFGTFMARVHQDLPGTTFSNVQHKVDYNSEGKAVMSLTAATAWFAAYITGVYHQSPHGGLDEFPPIHVWKQGVLAGHGGALATGEPPEIPNPERLRLDFLPYFECTVQRNGITQWHVHWYDGALQGFFNIKDPKTGRGKQYVVRYDPRDMSRVWLYDDKRDRYIEVRYANVLNPPVSLWQLKKARKTLRAQSKLAVDEALIFRTLQYMKALVTKEAAATAATRRQAQRQKEWEKTQKANRAKAAADQKAPDLPPQATVTIRDDEDDDDFIPPTGIREAQ